MREMGLEIVRRNSKFLFDINLGSQANEVQTAFAEVLVEGSGKCLGNS